MNKASVILTLVLIALNIAEIVMLSIIIQAFADGYTIYLVKR